MSRINLENSKRILEEIKNHYGDRTWNDVAARLKIPVGTLGSWRSKGGLDENIIYSRCPGVNLEYLKTFKGQLFNNSPQTASPIVCDQTPVFPSNLPRREGIEDLVSILERLPRDQYIEAQYAIIAINRGDRIRVETSSGGADAISSETVVQKRKIGIGQNKKHPDKPGESYPSRVVANGEGL